MNQRISLFVLAAMLLGFAVPSLAQDEEPTWLSITYVDVKPEMDTQFQDLLRTHWLPAAKKTDLPFMETWRAGRFGDAFQYAFVAPIRSFAEYDGTPPMLKVMKPEEYAVLYERLRKCVTGVRSVAYIQSPGLSYDHREGARPKHAVVATVRVRPGKEKAYAEVSKQLMAAFQKLEGHPALFTSQVVFGGNNNDWMHVVMIDSYAEIDKGPPLQRALGAEEAAKFEEKFNALIEHEELKIVDHLLEFSFRKE